ncbi:MAG: hypothetical protein LBG83_08995 [Oscillospiraceae bacterium]|nr:hypothetical protein [Oscillospiraceae bacterium]
MRMEHLRGRKTRRRKRFTAGNLVVHRESHQRPALLFQQMKRHTGILSPAHRNKRQIFTVKYYHIWLCRSIALHPQKAFLIGFDAVLIKKLT